MNDQAMAVADDGRRAFGGRRIGPHLPLAGGLLKAAERAREIGATAIQGFTDNPTAWRRRTAPPPELEQFRERLIACDIGPLAIHAPYLINLCGAHEAFWERSVATMVNELLVGESYGARFVNVHIGSHKGMGREAGIARLAEGLKQVLDEALAASATAGASLPVLVLENSAGSGDGIGSSIEDLAEIHMATAAAGLPVERLGFCLDTAHLWAAGYDVGSAAELDALIEQVDTLLGLERVVMLHLNDARTVRGSRLDRHEHVGAGLIGTGLRHVLLHPRLADRPVYLETPGMDSGFDAVNMQRVRLLLAGKPLPELPPEAFAAHGARSRSGPPVPGELGADAEADEAVA